MPMSKTIGKYARNERSQHGEDGIIERIFELAEVNNHWCVELGALNGTHDSNSWHLINNKRWSAVLIEADPTYFAKLQRLYENRPQVHCINQFVSFEGIHRLDVIFAETDLPRDFDLFVLDIDGNDYHVWESLESYRPRVVVVEFNPTIPNDIEFVQPRDMSVFQGSSLLALVRLARRKGYELVCANAANAFFVTKEIFPQCGITDNSLNTLHTDSRYYTRLYQLYDGTLKLDGYHELFWHHLPIEEEGIQVLSKRKRAYPAKISSNSLVRKLKYWARTLPFYTLVQKLRKR